MRPATRPPWSPNCEDVQFDHAAASAAAERCRRVAGLLDQAAEVVAVGALAAGETWTGRRRNRFDLRFDRLQRRRSVTAEDLRSFAGRIETAAEDATLEQRRRVSLREEWYAECRRLEARARAAAVADGDGR